MSSGWFHVKRFDAGGTTPNAVHRWVPETDNPSKDAEDAHKYLESGDKMRAEHKESMEALEAGMGSQSSQGTVGIAYLALSTMLSPGDDAVRLLATPKEGVSPFVQKNVYGQVEIPGKPLTVHCKDNFSCTWCVDPGLRCKFEDTLTDNCK